eukprot:488530-Rhodomonas_salina.3
MCIRERESREREGRVVDYPPREREESLRYYPPPPFFEKNKTFGRTVLRQAPRHSAESKACPRLPGTNYTGSVDFLFRRGWSRSGSQI